MNSKKEKRVLHDHTLLHYSWLNGREHKVATSLYSFASFNFTMEKVRDFSVTGHVVFLYRAWLLNTYHFFFIIAISICLINLSPRRILISIRTQQDKSPLTPLLSSFLRSEMLLLTSITAKKKTQKVSYNKFRDDRSHEISQSFRSYRTNNFAKFCLLPTTWLWGK